MNIEGTETPWRWTSWRWSNEGCKLGLVNFNVTLVFQWQKYKDSRCGEDFFRDRTIEIEDMKTFFKKRTIKWKYEDTFECRRFKMKIRRLLLEAELWRFKLRRHFSEGDLNIEGTKTPWRWTPWRCRNEGCKLGLVNFNVTLVFQWQKYKDSRCGEDFQRQNYRDWRYEDIFQEKNYKMKIWRYIRMQKIKDEDTKTTCVEAELWRFKLRRHFSEGDIEHWRHTKTPWRCRNEGCKLGLVNFNVASAFQWQKYKDSRCGEDFQSQNYGD